MLPVPSRALIDCRNPSIQEPYGICTRLGLMIAGDDICLPLSVFVWCVCVLSVCISARVGPRHQVPLRACVTERVSVRLCATGSHRGA